jgi:eukaryotic-like serine/threonine-protein kinase
MDPNETLVDKGVKPENAATGGEAPQAQVVDIDVIRKDLPMYEVHSEIGRGATGIVYEGLHKKLDRLVAIKIIRPQFFKSSSILTSFRKEAQLIARVKHENIASLYDFIEVDGRYYIIMEKISGMSLDDMIKNWNISEKETLVIMLGILEGIRHSHNKGILHLDLKPSNIILNEYGDPVIVDFGMSHFSLSGEKINSGKMTGTPYFMAPEQYSGHLDRISFRTDIYTLGVLFYQLLTRSLPFTGKTFQEIRKKVLDEEPKKLTLIIPKLSPSLEVIVLKMMHKNPDCRYMDTQAVIEDIRRYMKGELITPSRCTLITMFKKWIFRKLSS